MESMVMNNMQKVATLLDSLGPSRSAEILEHLPTEQVAKISSHLAEMENIPHHVKRTVLREFRVLVNEAARADSGKSSANRLLDQPAFLYSIAPIRASEILADEPLHIVAILLSSIQQNRAAEIISQLPEGMRSQLEELIPRISLPSPEVRSQLERAIRAKAAMMSAKQQVSGQEIIQEVAENTTSGEPIALEIDAAVKPTSLSKIADHKVGSFDRLGALPHSVLRQALAFIPVSELSNALFGADNRLAGEICAALPVERRIDLQNRLTNMQPLPLKFIRDAQKSIVRAAGRVLNEQEKERMLRTTGEAIHA